MTNIFVARLDYGVTQEQLRSAFEQYGQVNKASIAIDKETGRSKGFAFIEMENDTEARNAIQSLNGSTMNGREIAVKEAENREDNRPRRDFSNSPRRDFSGNDNKPFNRSERPAYNNHNAGSAGNTAGEYKNDYKKVDPPVSFNPFTAAEANKPERKKETPKKSESKAKTHKMEAYKKSGKKPRFDYDLDDEDY